MKFGYTIIYVTDVRAALAFYNKAFDIATRFIHDSGDYGELSTGDTVLAFAAHTLGTANLPGGYTPLSELPKPAGIEIALVTEDVAGAAARAAEVGATPIATPVTKPWGQTVAYVRAPDGTLIELCTPMGG